MCLNKLYLKSNKLEFNPLVDRMFNYVPCGKCSECLQQLQDGYVTRLLAHYDEVIKQGGIAFYSTLTYDRLHLPKFNDIVCFSKRDVQGFFKRLRSYLPNDIKLSYFLSSEYGTKNKRPHYHAVLFLSSPFSAPSFTKLVQRAWPFGTAYFGNFNGVIRDARPFGYCCKYIVKDCFALDYQESLSESVIKSFVELGNKKGYALFPFHFQSQGLGLALQRYIKDDNLVRGSVVFTSSLGISKRFQVPLYIYRKLCYNTYVNKNGNISYVLNERGKSILRSRLLYQHRQLVDNYNVLIDLLPNYYDKLPLLNHLFVSRSHFDSFIHNYKFYNTSYYLASYVILYDGVNYMPFSYTNFQHDVDVYLHHISDLDFLQTPLELLQYSEPDFQSDFSLCLQIFDQLQKVLKYDNYLVRQSLYNVKQRFRSYTSGVLKPCYICDFNKFINLTSSYQCLTIYQNYVNRAKWSHKTAA